MPKAKSKKSEETRNKILASAHKLFHKQGFEKTAVREIVEDVGIAKGTFYLYYETKYDVLKVLTLDFMRKFKSVLDHTMESDKEVSLKIKMILTDITDLISDNECCIYFFHTKEILELLKEDNSSKVFMETFLSPVIKLIDEGINEGYFRSVNKKLYASIILSTVHELLESSILYNYPAPVMVIKDELYEIIMRILKK